jgi:hypothetical protein
MFNGTCAFYRLHQLTRSYEANQSASESQKGIANPLLYIQHRKGIQSSLWREINGMKLYLETRKREKTEEKKFPGARNNDKQTAAAKGVIEKLRHEASSQPPCLRHVSSSLTNKRKTFNSGTATWRRSALEVDLGKQFEEGGVRRTKKTAVNLVLGSSNGSRVS